MKTWEKNLCEHRFADELLDTTPKETIESSDLIKRNKTKQNKTSVKDIVKRMKRQFWGELFASHISDKRFVYRI